MNCVPTKLRRTVKTAHVLAAMEQMVEMDLGRWEDKVFVTLGKYPD
jgi:hypothetical protein